MDTNNSMTLGSVVGGIGGAVAGQAGSYIMQGLFGNQQVNQQEKLARYNTMLNTNAQMAMWNNTAAPAQVAKLQAAGLNPGLMYSGGAGGASGQTGSGAVTGNVNGGQAQSGKEITASTMELQSQLASIEAMKAQAAAADSQAHLNDVKAANEGEGGNVHKNIEADTNNKGLQAQWQTVANQIQAETKSASIDEIVAKAGNLMAEQRIKDNEAHVAESTTVQQIEQIKQNLATTILQKGAIAAGINLTQEQTAKVINDVKIAWAQIDQTNKSRLQNQAQFEKTFDNELKKIGISEEMISSEKFRNYTDGISRILGNAIGAYREGKNPTAEPRTQINGFRQSY